MSGDSNHTNRLASSSSPYLLLHQHNPVDWYPWGKEALSRAQEEDKPIFVSVGYSTCYWCHVMERESFSNQGTAEMMNRYFINIKLDREERPDLDEIFMTATQILSGHGGWPNSVFLTPQRKPYFAGTYFPPEDRQGMPSFQTVLRSMADAWKNRREDVEAQGESVSQAIRHHLEDRPDPADEIPDLDVVDRSHTALRRTYDPEWGGFGSAPKFPGPPNLMLLEELADESDEAGEMLDRTLDLMARGGIYDRLGGGFHRYATDREWNIPHFEKMLYDNGWLLEAYARQWARSGDRQASQVVLETAAFLEREMTSPEGAFFSALDAETDGHEGAFYVWQRQELLNILDEENFGFLAPLFGFDQAAFFEGSSYVLHLPEPLSRQAERRRMPVEELEAQIEPLKKKLLRARSLRRRPLTDDKILTDWNGTTIGGLALAGRLLNESGLVDQAARAAEFVLEEAADPSGILLHVWRDGKAHTPAMLADYAYFVRGLLALHRASDDDRWSREAERLTRQQIDRLADPDGGFFVAAESDDLLVRSRDLFDGAQPAANAIAVLNLLELGRLDPDGDWIELAGRALRAFAPVIERVPEATRTLTIAVRRLAALEGRTAAESTKIASDRSRIVEAVLVESDVLATGEFALEIRIAAGWHLYADVPEASSIENLQPLRVEGRDVTISDLEISAPEMRDVPIHQGVVTISGRAEPAAGQPRLEVSYQACNDRRCAAPEVLTVGLSAALA